ncbi:MAG: cytochrome c-type biogenesis protein CcmH [Thermoanaerobacteraceae bacterium]|nr:cytochrome c-type biogenesis protein CcmH [Thermoanaerobacteraceae bacterium]
MRQKVILLLAVLLLNLVFALPALAEEYVVDEKLFKEIEANLMCTDGCGMYLKSCDNATAQQMRAEIRQKLKEGMTPEQIYGYMISIYGEEVMAAPPASIPFNIAAWVTPFLAILGGGLLIYTALDKWVFYRKTAESDTVLIDEADLAEYEELVDEEIKKYY